MRIPLAVSLESRDGTVTRDGKLLNALVEGPRVRKRPGLSDSGLLRVGVAQALAYFNSAMRAVVGDYLIGGNSSAVSWNASDKGAGITLSNGNLTATMASSTTDGVRSNQSFTSGTLRYVEFTAPAGVAGTSNISVGIADASWGVTSDQMGNTTHSIEYRPDGAIRYNASTLNSAGAWTAGDIIAVAASPGVSVKFYKNNVLQYTATNIPTGATWYFSAGGQGAGVSKAVVANFGATTFTYTPPAGYSGFAASELIIASSTALNPTTASLPFSMQANGANAGTQYLMFKNASQAWTLDINNTVTAITDVDYPGQYAVTLTSLTRSGTVATATVATDTNFQVGSSVTIAGATPSAYNGAQTITGVTPTTTVEHDLVAVTLTRSSTTATATSTNGPHGFTNGQMVTIAGANEAAYNGDHAITWISATQFSFTVTVTTGGSTTTNYNLTSPATGTISVYFSGGRSASANFNANGSTATFTMVGHGYSTGQNLYGSQAGATILSGATITVTDANTFTATVDASAQTYWAGKTNVFCTVYPTPVAVSSVTASGTTATVTFSAAHNYSPSDRITITGATQSYYNLSNVALVVTSSTTVTYQLQASTTATDTPASPATGVITAKTPATITGSSFTFTIAGSPTTPASGTITATGGRNTVPGIVYLNGYFFVMDVNGVIYNSAIDNPTNWNALEYLAAQNEPGAGVALAKALNYVIAFKEWSTEFFYDAQKPIGSPLAPVDNGFTLVGCAAGTSVKDVCGALVWVAQEKKTKGRSVYLMVGIEQQKVSTPDIERILNADDLATVYAIGCKLDGHRLYVLSLVTSNLTLVYDLDAQTWTQWSSNTAGNTVSVTSITRVGTTATVTATAHGIADGDPVLIAGANQSGYNGVFQARYVSSSVFTIEVTGSPVTPATGTITSAPYTESYYKFIQYADCNNVDNVLHVSDGHLYKLDATLFQDAGIPINWFGRTQRLDGGSLMKKTMGRLDVVGDKTADTLMARWSDDDSATFSAYRLVDLSVKQPSARRCGDFRRRSMELRHIGNSQIRLEALEPEIQEG